MLPPRGHGHAKLVSLPVMHLILINGSLLKFTNTMKFIQMKSKTACKNCSLKITQIPTNFPLPPPHYDSIHLNLRLSLKLYLVNHPYVGQPLQLCDVWFVAQQFVSAGVDRPIGEYITARYLFWVQIHTITKAQDSVVCSTLLGRKLLAEFNLRARYSFCARFRSFRG